MREGRGRGGKCEMREEGQGCGRSKIWIHLRILFNHHPLTLSPFHIVIMSCCHYADLMTPLSPYTIISYCHSVTLSHCHPVTLSPCHIVTMSHCHPVTLSPCHIVTCHIVTLLVCAVQQSSYYGMAGMLPKRYTQATQAGEGEHGSQSHTVTASILSIPC